MTKKVVCVERIVAKAMAERGQTSAVFKASMWTAFKDARGVWLMHYGTPVACLTEIGAFVATATSASDRDGVNTFCMMVKGKEAVRIRKQVNKYGISWWKPVKAPGVGPSGTEGIFVEDTPGTLDYAVHVAYRIACDKKERSISVTRAVE